MTPRPVPRFDGRSYRNPPDAAQLHTYKDYVMWAVRRNPSQWPKHLHVAQRRPQQSRVSNGEMLAHWVGQSTVLLQVEGQNLLTDPHWSLRSTPIPLTPVRVALPGISYEALPPIDGVMLSHDHYDHFDLPSLRRIIRDHDPYFVVPRGMGRLVHKLGGSPVTELSWWESVSHGSLQFHAVPAQHWSSRTAGRNRTLWCGWVVRTSSNGSFFHVGDTGWWERAFAAIGEAFDDIRLAAIPIGAYEPSWFMGKVHINPDEAVDLFELVGAQSAVGVHHRTFQLTDEPIDEPADRLSALLARRGLTERFRVVPHGAHLAG